MTEYTMDIHIKRLKEILTKPDPSEWCPQHIYPDIYENTCEICKSFVGIEKGCPCITLGEEEAIRKTKEAIKEYERKNAMKKITLSSIEGEGYPHFESLCADLIRADHFYFYDEEIQLNDIKNDIDTENLTSFLRKKGYFKEEKPFKVRIRGNDIIGKEEIIVEAYKEGETIKRSLLFKITKEGKLSLFYNINPEIPVETNANGQIVEV
jgi:hypothetical protein